MEWHENIDEYHKTKYGFLSHLKAKVTEFGDQQTSKISVYIQNTSRLAWTNYVID